jgi:hypothetical protein
MRVRGGSGLGDSLYLRAVAEYFIRSGQQVTVCSNYGELFLGLDCKVEPFTRQHVDIVAHYAAPKQKENKSTTQWEDVCQSAGIPPMPLCFTWQCRNPGLVQELRTKAAGRPLVLIHGGRTPMGRSGGFGKELLPNKFAFDAVLAALGDAYTIRIGHGAHAYPLQTSLDLNGATTVSDLMDLGQACDGMVGQCSWAVPLAEGFAKPLVAVWAARGLKAAHQYVRQITPAKILSAPTSRFVMDDWPATRIQEETIAFRGVF